jgi:hypothetical protein
LVCDAEDVGYEVEVCFAVRSLSEAFCDCSKRGLDGRCRHVAALLISWREAPETFLEVEDLDAALARRTREELEDLIRELVGTEPSLEERVIAPAKLEHPESGSSPGSKRVSISLETIRKRVGDEFHRTPGDSEAAAWDLAGRLSDILSEGRALFKQGQIEAASRVYAGVLLEASERYEEVHDECQVHEQITEAARSLVPCLKESKEGEALRGPAVDALYQFWIFAMEYAGARDFHKGKHLGSVLHRILLPRERTAFSLRARELLSEAITSSYRKEEIGEFLLQFEKDVLDVEGVLALCRETGRYGDLLPRLLKLKRFDRALEVLGEVSSERRTKLAEVLLGHGRDLDVFKEVDRLVGSEKPRFSWTHAPTFRWLALGYEKCGETLMATEKARLAFLALPSAEGFAIASRVARKARRWSKLRPELLAAVGGSRHAGDRILILLEDGDLKGAAKDYEVYRKSPGRRPHSGSWKIGLKLAEAAEGKHPDLACELHLKVAGEVVGGRNPGDYPLAVRGLKRIVELSRGRRSEAKWAAEIEGFKTSNRRFSALQRLLKRAKL